jgi:hypothetical protein
MEFVALLDNFSNLAPGIAESLRKILEKYPVVTNYQGA